MSKLSDRLPTESLDPGGSSALMNFARHVRYNENLMMAIRKRESQGWHGRSYWDSLSFSFFYSLPRTWALALFLSLLIPSMLLHFLRARFPAQGLHDSVNYRISSWHACSPGQLFPWFSQLSFHIYLSNGYISFNSRTIFCLTIYNFRSDEIISPYFI